MDQPTLSSTVSLQGLINTIIQIEYGFELIQKAGYIIALEIGGISG